MVFIKYSWRLLFLDDMKFFHHPHFLDRMQYFYMVSFFSLSLSFISVWLMKRSENKIHTLQSNIQKSRLCKMQIELIDLLTRKLNDRFESDLSIYIRHSSTKSKQTIEASKLSPTSKQAVYNIILFHFL